MPLRPVALLAAALFATPALAEEITVTMAGSTYAPAMIAASVGDTIRFVNDDGTDHNVFVPTAGHAIDFGKQEPGQEAMLTLAKPGKLEVECVFHAGMVTQVEVN